MRSIPELPVRSPHRYMEVSCPDCGAVRFYKRRHLLDGPGDGAFICVACGGAQIRRRDVSDWSVLARDPLGRRRLERAPDFAEAVRKNPAEAVRFFLSSGKPGLDDEAE